ncbi:MAG: M28 family peptidase [Candidatus Sericytochromatia bacterium]|nr:M28 family peptidase [Candidatus Sericytochromatia bacterium]
MRVASSVLLPWVASALVVALSACTTAPLLRSPSAQRSIGVGISAKLARLEQAVSRDRLGTRLSVLSGASTFTPTITIPERGSVQGRALTRQMITETLQAQGYSVESHRYRNHGENVLARLLADEPSDEWILLGAHLDSVRNAGADDNGSGSAAVLEAATVMRQCQGRKVNVLFAFFDEEELGLVGSQALAKDLRKQRLNLTSAHTADMIGFDADRDGAVEIERPDGQLWDYYQMVNRSHGLNLPLVRTSSGDTDHVAFRQQGFASVGMCEEWVGGDTTPHYHRKTDTFSTLNLDFLTSTTQLMVAVLADLVTRVPPPPLRQSVPHSQFPGRARHFHPDGHF